MRTLYALLLALMMTAGASAQQQPDPAFMQRSIAAIQLQRNAALDMAARAEAIASGLAADLAQAQARIKELEQKQPDVKQENSK